MKRVDGSTHTIASVGHDRGMNRPPLAIPFRPDFQAAASANTQSYWRAIAAIAIAHQDANEVDPLKVARDLWKDDGGAALFTKAAVSPTDTSTAALTATQIGAFLSGIAPASAAARLFAECARVALNQVYSIKLPAMSPANAPTGAWCAEGAPIPAVQGFFGSVEVGPSRKLAFITGLSQELDDASNAEQILRTAISENAGRTLDRYFFDNAAASSLRPAGILNGVVPIAPTVGGGLNALTADMQNLVGAIVTAGGGANIRLFANPAQAMALRMFAPLSTVPVVPTAALALHTVVALEVNGIVSGFSGAPEIITATEAEVVWDDNPPPVATGSPAVVGAPTRSGWQQVHKLLKMILRCAWCVRGPGLVQVINTTTW